MYPWRRLQIGDVQPQLEWAGRVGSRAPRYEGAALALGMKPFINDMHTPDMLHGALRFSDHPRAVVKRIDISKARAMPGVVSVVLAADVPGDHRRATSGLTPGTTGFADGHAAHGYFDTRQVYGLGGSIWQPGFVE